MVWILEEDANTIKAMQVIFTKFSYMVILIPSLCSIHGFLHKQSPYVDRQPDTESFFGYLHGN